MSTFITKRVARFALWLLRHTSVPDQIEALERQGYDLTDEIDRRVTVSDLEEALRDFEVDAENVQHLDEAVASVLRDELHDPHSDLAEIIAGMIDDAVKQRGIRLVRDAS